MLIEPLGDGGIAHYTLNLANAVAKKSCNVFLFTSSSFEKCSTPSTISVYPNMFRLATFLTNLFPFLTRETGISHLFRRLIKLFEYPFNTIEALLIAKKNKINIIHFQSVNEVEILMILAARLIGLKVVYTVHNVNPRHGKIKFYHLFLYRIMYGFSNHLIIHSQSGKDELGKLFSVPPNKVAVIPHGDYKFFLPKQMVQKNEAKASLGISELCKTILFFGAIRPNKGLDNILLALPHIKSQHSNIKLLIVGELCESYKRYKAIIDRNDLVNEVYEKLSYIPNNDIALYFTAADVVVLPYNEITQSGVLQIAYAFGKPVVAFAIGGFKESIVNGSNGYLVPPHDINLLSAKISTILSDDKKMEQMGKFSRHLSDTHYSWTSIADQTIKVYSQCVLN